MNQACTAATGQCACRAGHIAFLEECVANIAALKSHCSSPLNVVKGVACFCKIGFQLAARALAVT